MYDRAAVLGHLDEALEAVRRIDRRFEGIGTAEEFVEGDEGLDRLDAIAMMLIAVGENVKKIDKLSDGKLLAQFPEIHWPGVKGTRDVIAHDYFFIDHEEIFNICKNDLQPLRETLGKMRILVQQPPEQ